MRILTIISALFILCSNSVLAHGHVMPDLSPRELSQPPEITTQNYFRDRQRVAQMQGIVSAGRVNSNSLVRFEISSISGRDTICVVLGQDCFAIAPSLSKESILRIGYWAATGNYKVFSCLWPESREAKILKSEGFVDAGRSGKLCGNMFVHATLNFEELLRIFRHIDFGSYFVQKCSTVQLSYLDEWRLDRSTRPTKGLVNMDSETVYEIATQRNIDGPVLQFSNSPRRYHWTLPDKGPAIVEKRCNAKPPSTNSRQKQALAFFHVAALFRKAVLDDSNAVIQFINTHINEFR